MAFLTTLWLPILLSAVAVFFASSIIWMALPIHKKDYKQFKAHDDKFLSTLRAIDPAPGMYMFPGCDHKTMKNDPAAMAKYNAGPWGVVLVGSGPWSMGKMMGQWIVNLLILSVLIGYLAYFALPVGASFASVFRIVATAALLAHAGNVMCDSIWKARPWSLLPGALFDGIVYAAVTGAVFGYFWPAAGTH